MRNISGAMETHLSSEVTTLAWCWKATRKDGVVFGFTNHDIDLTVSGLVYKADTGLTATNAEAKLGLSVDNLDINGILDSSAITEEDLRSGLWDQAAIEVFIVNWKDTTQKLIVQSGTLGDVTIKKGQFTAEMRSISQALQNTVGRIMTRRCDANFADSRCSLNKWDWTYFGTVTAIIDDNTFSHTADASTHYSYEDPYYSNTLMLVRFDGVDASTTLPDDKANFVLVANNTAALTTSESKSEGASLKLTRANSDYVVATPLAGSIELNDNFTAECWIKPLSNLAGTYQNIMSFSRTGSKLLCVSQYGNQVVVRYAGVNRITSSGITINAWSHVKLIRQNNVLKLYINDVAVGTTYAFAGNFSTDLLHIGASINASVPGEFFDGYIDEMRITNYARTVSMQDKYYPWITPNISIINLKPGGLLTWVTGDNFNTSMETSVIDPSNISIAIPMPNSIQIGDTFKLVSGCDKNLDTCSTFYSNVINFRGYPHIPGQDKVLAYPNAK